MSIVMTVTHALGMRKEEPDQRRMLIGWCDAFNRFSIPKIDYSKRG